MKHLRLPLAETNRFSSIFLDYINQHSSLSEFYSHFPTVENLKKQLEAKAGFSAEKRKVLHKELARQYANINLSTSEKHNLEALKAPQTFTITTGHQLNIFSGPLYFIYKILTAVKACEQLKEAYPDYNFVPVYWMASEDHDLEEIQYFNLFGKKYTWETEQTGAVGRMNPNGLAQLAKDLPEPAPIFEKAYTEEKTLAAATRRFVHELFAQWGVLSIDADSSALKQLFIPVLEEELLQQKTAPLVNQQSGKLEELGYKAQVYPRPINLFYLKGNQRERLEKEGNNWQVLNTDIAFSEAELLTELKEHPERFSPNVVLRPLYQEWILPNLAYIGGPGELAYWLQLKPVFEQYQIPFPVLLPRQFALVISQSLNNRREKLNLEIEQLFSDSHSLRNQLLQENSENEFSLSQEQEELSELFRKIEEKAQTIDGSLSGFIGAEHSKAAKSLSTIEKRLKKAEEQRHEVTLKQMDNLLEKLFPAGGLQERYDNLLNFYLNDSEFIMRLHKAFDAFNLDFNILSYTHEDEG